MPLTPDMKLRDLLPIYAAERGISERAADTLKWSLVGFDRWHVLPVRVCDLNAELVNRYLMFRTKLGRAPETIRQDRGAVLCLWNYALNNGLTEESTRRLRKPPQRRYLPVAWSREEMQTLLDAASRFNHRMNRCDGSWSLYWTAWILVQWDSGLRMGDMLKLRREMIAADGTATLIQGKNGWPLQIRLRPETMEAVDALPRPESEPRIFWLIDRRYFFQRFRALMKFAGLKGGTHKIRRSSATWLEAEHPGAAMAHLGHKTPGLAYRHYVDPRYVQANKPMPPMPGTGPGIVSKGGDR